MGGLPSYCAFYVRFCSTQRIVAFDECMNPNGLGQPLETWLTDLIEYGHFKISGLHLHLTQQVIGKSSDILVCWWHLKQSHTHTVCNQWLDCHFLTGSIIHFRVSQYTPVSLSVARCCVFPRGVSHHVSGKRIQNSVNRPVQNKGLSKNQKSHTEWSDIPSIPILHISPLYPPFPHQQHSFSLPSRLSAYRVTALLTSPCQIDLLANNHPSPHHPDVSFNSSCAHEKRPPTITWHIKNRGSSASSVVVPSDFTSTFCRHCLINNPARKTHR